MRKFYLQNQAGARRDLNGADGVWLTDPYGLGIDGADDYADQSLGFYLLTQNRERQAAPGGVLMIRGNNPYAKYRELATWMLQASELYLIYDPDGTEFMRRVDINSITKTELGGTRWMAVPVSFAVRTPWYLPVAAVLQLTPAGNNVLRWDVGAWDISVWGAEELPGASAEILPVGQLPASFRMTAHGAISNPVISLVGSESRTTYGCCRLSMTFNADEGFILDTTEDGAGIWKIGADGSLTGIINVVDLAYEPFPRAPISESCILQVDSESGAVDLQASAVIYQYYRTV